MAIRNHSFKKDRAISCACFRAGWWHLHDPLDVRRGESPQITGRACLVRLHRGLWVEGRGGRAGGPLSVQTPGSKGARE